MSVTNEEKLVTVASNQVSVDITEKDSVNEVNKFSNVEETARLQQQVEHQYTRWEAIKAYPRASMYILGVLWVMILVGFENQAGSLVISIPAFRKDFGYYYEGSYVLDSNWQSAISGGPTATMIIGGYVGSSVADIIGRKYTLLIAVLTSICFVIIEYVATTIQVFFAGKFLNALSLGMITIVATSYMAEITPLALRGISTAALNLSLCIGPFVCYLIENTTAERTDRMAYRALFISQWAFSAISVVVLVFTPESPYFYVMKGKNEKALKQLRLLYSDEVTAQQQLAIIGTTIAEAEELSQSSSYLECFKGTNLRRTLCSILPWFVQTLSGVMFISSYSTYYYQLAGYDTSMSFKLSIAAQVLSITGTISSWFILDKFGRRKVLFYGCIALATLNLIAGAGGCSSKTGAYKMVSAFIVLYNYVYNIAIGPIAYVITAEHPTSRLRSKTISIGISFGNAIQTMWAFVLPYMFNPDQANMGSKICFIFFACTIVLAAVAFIWLPETANRSFEEIDEMYAQKVPARQFESYVCHFEKPLLEREGDLTKGVVDHVEVPA